MTTLIKGAGKKFLKAYGWKVGMEVLPIDYEGVAFYGPGPFRLVDIGSSALYFAAKLPGNGRRDFWAGDNTAFTLMLPSATLQDFL